MEVKGEAKSRWKHWEFLLQSMVSFSPPHQKPYPASRTAAASGNSLKSKTGSTRVRGRDPWLVVSPGRVQHFFWRKRRGERRADFAAGSCKACRAKDRVRERAARITPQLAL